MIHIGSAGWAYDFWSLYPVGTTNKLTVYAEHSLLTEINSTFYRLPNEQTVQNWHDSVPDDFMFAAKLLRAITHQEGKYHLNKGKLVEFFDSMAPLREKHKFTLLQFPYSFKLTEENKYFLLDLLDFVYNFHSNLVLEFRHPSWNSNEHAAEIHNYIEKKKILLCDSLSGIPRILQQQTVYLRMLGSRKMLPDEVLGRVKLDKSEDIKRLATWIITNQNIKDFYIFFSNQFSGDPVRDARLLHKQLIDQGVKASGFPPELSLMDFI